jgi:hypothetical protein
MGKPSNAASPPAPLTAAYRLTAATLSWSFVKRGILAQPPDTAKLIDTQFLPEH